MCQKWLFLTCRMLSRSCHQGDIGIKISQEKLTTLHHWNRNTYHYSLVPKVFTWVSFVNLFKYFGLIQITVGSHENDVKKNDDAVCLWPGTHFTDEMFSLRGITRMAYESPSYRNRSLKARSHGQSEFTIKIFLVTGRSHLWSRLFEVQNPREICSFSSCGWRVVHRRDRTWIPKITLRSQNKLEVNETGSGQPKRWTLAKEDQHKSVKIKMEH